MTFSLFFFADVFFFAEQQSEHYAHEHARYPEDGHEKCGSRALSAAEDGTQSTALALARHQRLEEVIYKCAARQPAYRYGEKLQRVAAGIHSPLHFGRDRASEYYVQIGTHKGYEQPAEHHSDAPHGRRLTERKYEVLGAHREEQRQTDSPYPVFRRRCIGSNQAPSECSHADTEVDRPEYALAVRLLGKDHRRQCRIVCRGYEIYPREEEDELEYQRVRPEP